MQSLGVYGGVAVVAKQRLENNLPRGIDKRDKFLIAPPRKTLALVWAALLSMTLKKSQAGRHVGIGLLTRPATCCT